jgi:hypothetical protein
MSMEETLVRAEEQDAIGRALRVCLAAWRVSDLTQTLPKPSRREVEAADDYLTITTLEVSADDLDVLAALAGENLDELKRVAETWHER